jgi:hypothetical protein
MGHAVTHEKEWPLVAATLRDWLANSRLELVAEVLQLEPLGVSI